jgi:hypothetical protein
MPTATNGPDRARASRPAKACSSPRGDRRDGREQRPGSGNDQRRQIHRPRLPRGVCRKRPFGLLPPDEVQEGGTKPKLDPFHFHYTDDEYVEAITAARAAGIGPAYATKMLGADVDALLRGVEQDSGQAIVRAAESNLLRRGIDPAKATYQQYADALVQVSP